MRRRREDLINFALVIIIFTGAAAAGATILAAEINQVFTYISTRLANYTTQARVRGGFVRASRNKERFLCEMRF